MATIQKIIFTYHSDVCRYGHEQKKLFTIQLIYQTLMNDLDSIVKQLYGKRMAKCKAQGNPHFLFNVYEDTQTRQIHYLRTIQLPTFLYISEASTELIKQKYGNLIPKFKITPVDRQFQVYTYLVRSPFNIMPLSAFLQVKKQCGEVLDIDFFLHFLEFAKNSFKIVESQKLPLFSISQIGVTESGDFVLSDPSFYFSGHNGATIKDEFGMWIAGFIRDVLNLPINNEEQQQLLRQYFGQYLQGIRPFFDYLMSGEATLEVTQGKLANAIIRFSEDISTVTGSSVDVNDLIERNQKQIGMMRTKQFKKMGPLAKGIIVLVVFGILSGIGVFCYKFFNRNIQCMQGQFQGPNNQCLSCIDGCLRCEDGSENRCTKCDQNMFLVIANEHEKEGYCTKQCKGRVIRADVCVREEYWSPYGPDWHPIDLIDESLISEKVNSLNTQKP